MPRIYVGSRQNAASKQSSIAAFKGSLNASTKSTHAEHHLLTMQRTIGNRAVLRRPPRQDPDPSAPSGGGPRWDFSRIPVFPPEGRDTPAPTLSRPVPAPSFIQSNIEVVQQGSGRADKLQRQPVIGEHLSQIPAWNGQAPDSHTAEEPEEGPGPVSQGAPRPQLRQPRPRRRPRAP
jgi:hypothetical protein